VTFWIWRGWAWLGTCSMFELPEEGTVTVDIRNISDIDERVDVLKDRICFIGGLVANSRSG